VTAPIVVSLVDRKETVWAEEVERLRGAFGAPWNPLLFPQHFLASTFPKIGGQLARFEQEGALIAVGSLFPRGVRPDGRRIYTLRFHPVRKGESGAWVRPLLPEIGATLGGAKIVFYDPAQPHQFERTNRVLPQGIGIGTPSDEEAQTIRHLQETIWGAEDDALYPADLHSLGFGAGTTLVARQEGQLSASSSASTASAARPCRRNGTLSTVAICGSNRNSSASCRPCESGVLVSC
jgi:hypothetical protein